MFVTKSTHQEALAEIESLQAQLEDSRRTVQILDEKLGVTRKSRDKLVYTNACLTALCQYLPEGVYHVKHQATYGGKKSAYIHSTSVHVDHKAAKNANRNYTIKHEPLPRDTRRILVDLQQTLNQTYDAYAKAKQEQLGALYIGWYAKVNECMLKRIALNAQIISLKQKIKLIELGL